MSAALELLAFGLGGAGVYAISSAAAGAVDRYWTGYVGRQNARAAKRAASKFFIAWDLAAGEDVTALAVERRPSEQASAPDQTADDREAIIPLITQVSAPGPGAPKKVEAPKRPKRRPVVQWSLFGASYDPSAIPDDAKSAKWEAKHLFSAFAPRPTRHAHGVHIPEPPLALVCPECDLKQAPLGTGQARECEYCGTFMIVHGTRIYWWAEGDDVPAGPWTGGDDGRV